MFPLNSLILKKQQDALDSQVKALTKKKEGKCYDIFRIDKFEECIYVAI